MNLKKSLANRKHENGFTMMELLIVLLIVGLLTALVGPAIFQRVKPAKQSAARAQIKNFMTALDGYFIDVGRFPTSQQGLIVLREAPQGEKKWRGPYLKQNIPNDPWGNPFIYRQPGRSGGYEILSYGADGREGGDGENQDILSWDSGQ